MTFLKIITDGLMGFAFFFTVIFIIKLFMFLLGISHSLDIEVMDIYHSAFGFLFTLNHYTQRILRKF
jgi:hypothetical protein